MKKYLIVFACFAVSSLLPAFGQDIHFSQYNLTPLVVNPAQAGAYKSQEVILNYKSQWTSISPNGYKTMMLSYDGRFNQRKWKTKWLAGGINLFNDKAGDGNMRTMQGNAYFGYHTQLSDRSTLGGALVAGFTQRDLKAPFSGSGGLKAGYIHVITYAKGIFGNFELYRWDEGIFHA